MRWFAISATFLLLAAAAEAQSPPQVPTPVAIVRPGAPAELATPSVAAPPKPAEATAVIILAVTRYVPGRGGNVELVVSAEPAGAGARQEIGRFSMFPNRPFRARTESEVKRFSFEAPACRVEPGAACSYRVVIEMRTAGRRGRGAMIALRAPELELR